MGNLAKDTEVTSTGADTYEATISPEWAFWGPNGGYLAGIMLRAAGAYTGMPKPASIHCQFLRVPATEPVVLRIETLVRSRRAHSVWVRMYQRDRLVATAAVWGVVSRPSGPQTSWGCPPDVPPPAQLRRIDELLAEEGTPVMPIWQTCCEVRLARWGGPEREAGEPAVFGWLRLYEPFEYGVDPWLDGCRALFAMDSVQFPAIGQGFAAREMTFIAPSLDLYTSFHDQAGDDEWLLLRGEGVAAGDGLLSARAATWSPAGRLLATSTQQMLVREFG